MKHLASVLFLLFALASAAMEPVVEFVTPSIVRVRWNAAEPADVDNATGVCVYSPAQVSVEREERCGLTRLLSDSLIVSIPAYPGGISFIDRVTGDTLLRETPYLPRVKAVYTEMRKIYDDSSARLEDTANGKVTVKDVVGLDTVATANEYIVRFLTRPSEGLYGLGSHMEDYMNLLGRRLYLTQHNLKAFIPMLVSTAGYGLLFDAGCSMTFDSRPSDDGPDYVTSMRLCAAKTLDYYFIKGPTPSDVTAGYRYLTGAPSLLPLYAFGYIQSKERYTSSDDILSTLREYRRRRVPIDMIVQDWNYWPEGWGYMKMNRDFYPSPRALADSVHALDARLMVSIWPNPQYCPQADDFSRRGLMLEHSVYDAFSEEGRDLYWKYADSEFFSNGFDAWWCDSSEPLDGDWNQLPEPEEGVAYGRDSHRRRFELNNSVLSEALGAERACLYSLYHSRGIYEHQRAASTAKRVVNLTRSSFAGQQRYGTVVWNGDTYASWPSLRQQIASGLNYMATGSPYWTVDVGCFFTRTDPRWFYKGEFPDGAGSEAYREFYVRMLQWATYLPLLRSHGTDTPREIWHFGEEGTPHYDAILKMINTRYALLPYIYSMAARQQRDGYTMARPLSFDFPADKLTLDVADQYMFGSMMVCPVTEPSASCRSVYLPATPGGWTELSTGRRYEGGDTVTAHAPIDVIPVYVRAGSIIPLAPPMQHSGELASKPLDIKIFDGCNAAFTLYQDAGDGYGFEQGEWREILFDWDDLTRRLTITSQGEGYPGAPDLLSFNISVAGTPSRSVSYHPGSSLTLDFARY